jgi:hypothetical protein
MKGGVWWSLPQDKKEYFVFCHCLFIYLFNQANTKRIVGYQEILKDGFLQIFMIISSCFLGSSDILQD